MTEFDNMDDRTRSQVPAGTDATIRQYRILRPLGRGGMGEVFLAEDTSLKRFVALKFIAAEYQENEDLRSRFVREAQAAAKLGHPNVVTIHEVGEHDGRPFFAMEYVDGESLKSYAARQELAPEQIVALARQVAEGLEAAHRQGVVHRDIKPANILVEKSGRARIVDFGLAAVAGSDQITEVGSTLGTIGYMSPEQVRGEPVDQRSDLFSFGIVLYELLAGKRPFVADTEAAVLYAIVNSAPPPLPSVAGIDGSRLETVIDRLLCKEPSDRYHSAGDLLVDLQALSGSGGVTTPDQPSASIAVLPFANLSTDPEQEYFCDGIAEDIISDLKHIKDLRVVARTSAFAFKGKNEDVRQIGRKLNVGYVLEGSVRKGGSRVRITAQLIEVASGYHLWSERYDRQLEDIFAIQDDISHAIVEKLKLQLGNRRGERRQAGVASIEAYELYSQGRHELNKRTLEGFNAALGLFEQCLAAAPEFAPAHTGLADTYFLLFAYDLMSPRDAIARGRVAAQEAIDLNAELADTHATLGGIHTFYDWAWQDAEQSFLKALELSPGHTTAHQWYGELLTFLGRRREAEQHLQLAHQQDPLSTVVLTMLGWHYLRFGAYASALPLLAQAVELGSENDYTHVLQAQALIATGERDRGWEALERADSISDGGSVMTITMKAHYAAAEDRPAVAQEMLARLQEKRSEEYVPQAYFATLYLAIGDEAKAIACLKESIRRHDAELIFMAVMPYYRPIRQHPQVATLLSVLGLSEA